MYHIAGARWCGGWGCNYFRENLRGAFLEVGGGNSGREARGGLTHLIVVAALDDMHQSEKLFQVVRFFVLIDLDNERFDAAA